MVMFYAIAVLCFSSTALAQIAGWGPCPDVDAMQDFHLSKIAGEWYEAGRYYPSSHMPIKCVKSYIKKGDEGTMILDATAIHTSSGHLGAISDVELRVADPAEPGKLIVKFPSSNAWGNYWILGTDYNSYILGYSCLDLKFINLKYLWISTKDQHPSEVAIAKALEVMDKQKLGTKFLLKTEQNDCTLKPFTGEIDAAEESTILF